MIFFTSMLSRGYVRAVIALVALALIAAGAYLLYASVPQGPAPTTFFECAQRYAVKEAFPRACRVPWGATFVEYVGNLPQVENEIRVTGLPPAPVITFSPLEFSGEALQSWYDSAGTFEVELVAGTGEILASAKAQQNSDSEAPATRGFARFTVSLAFTPPAANTAGALVLKKSGSEQALVVPVFF